MEIQASDVTNVCETSYVNRKMSTVEKQKVLNVDSFLKTLDSTNGRDKLGKLIQYAARFSAWYLAKYNPSDKASIAKATSVQKGVASARKLTRLLKWWPLLMKLQDAILKKGLNHSLNEVLRHLSSFGLANYFFWDNMNWAIGVGLMKGDAAKYGKWSMYGWFFGLAFAIIADTLALFKAIKDHQKASSSSSAPGTASTASSSPCNTCILPADQCKKFALLYAKNFSDLCVSAKGIQLADFSEGWLGICGMVASLVGFYELWPSQ